MIHHPAAFGGSRLDWSGETAGYVGLAACRLVKGILPTGEAGDESGVPGVAVYQTS